jgi:copper(I)-binding protein
MKALVAAALLLALALAAQAAPPVRVESAWSRPSPPGVTVAVGYLELVNDGAADRLVRASSPRARTVEFHESTLDKGVERMRELPSVPLPARGRVRFAPGGLHLMLLGLTRPFVAGDAVPLVLEFEKAGRVATTLLVGADGAPPRH